MPSERTSSEGIFYFLVVVSSKYGFGSCKFSDSGEFSCTSAAISAVEGLIGDSPSLNVLLDKLLFIVQLSVYWLLSCDFAFLIWASICSMLYRIYRSTNVHFGSPRLVLPGLSLFCKISSRSMVILIGYYWFSEILIYGPLWATCNGIESVKNDYSKLFDNAFYWPWGQK